MKNLLNFFLFLFLLVPEFLYASINMRSGSYTENWVDVITPGSGKPFKIERFYDSRSIFIGVFGFGWCSEFESYIEKKSDGTLVLTECGGGVELTYYPTFFDRISPEQTASQIISEYKKKGEKKDFKKLKKNLIANTQKRFKEASRLHIINPLLFKNRTGSFVNSSEEFKKINFNGAFYTRNYNDGKVEKYDNQGRLVKISNKKNQWIQINHKKYQASYSRISFIMDDRGRRFNFFYTKTGQLWKIQNEKNLKILYKFENENLVQVTNAWGNTYKYFYDQNNNITKVEFPKKNGRTSSIFISYNLERDWVQSYKDRQGCLQKFQFITLSKENYKSVISGECSKELFYGKFQYWHSNYTWIKEKYLSRNLINKKTTYRVSGRSISSSEDIYFHPYFGKPSLIKKNKEDMKYSYYPYGLLHQEEKKTYDKNKNISSWSQFFYNYDLKNYNIKKTIQKNLTSKGKLKSNFYTFYKYDKNNLLRKVQKKSGPFVKLNYNQRGQLYFLSDHKNNNFTLSYNDISEKPVKIKHGSLGEISIEYSPDGSIFRTHSPKGKKVATSVVKAFMEFLNILGPVAQGTINI